MGIDITTPTYSVTGFDWWLKKLDAIRRQQCIFKCLTENAKVYQGFVRKTKLSGQVLHRISGDLSRSILYGQPYYKGQNAEIKVGSNMVYARIHEYGGIIKNGFGRGVIIRMPMRSYLRSTLVEENVKWTMVETTNKVIRDFLNAGVY